MTRLLRSNHRFWIESSTTNLGRGVEGILTRNSVATADCPSYLVAAVLLEGDVAAAVAVA